MARTTAKKSAGKRQLQNALRRSRGQKTVTRLRALASEMLTGLYDETLTLPDLAYGLKQVVQWATDIDGRRAPLDPSKGGKAV